MAAKELSPTMTDCLALARANGGELIRYQGGFWAARNADRSNGGIPRPFHGTKTVQALVDRGRASYSEHKQGRVGEFPIAMKINESAG